VPKDASHAQAAHGGRGQEGGSSGMYSRSSIVSSEALTSKSQSDISFGIVGLQSQTSAARATSSALASNTARSISSAGGGRRGPGRGEEEEGGRRGGQENGKDTPEPGDAAGKVKKGLFKRLNLFTRDK
jgi:hypothetical protein